MKELKEVGMIVTEKSKKVIEREKLLKQREQKLHEEKEAIARA